MNKQEAWQDALVRLAIDRTVMANERTYLTWLRAGLALLATGLAAMKFMVGVIATPALLTVSSLLIVGSALFFLLGAWRYGHIRLRMRDLDVETTPIRQAWIISLILAACALLSLGGILWLAPWR